MKLHCIPNWNEMKFVCRKIKKNTLWGNRFYGVYECLIKHSVGSDNISQHIVTTACMIVLAAFHTWTIWWRISRRKYLAFITPAKIILVNQERARAGGYEPYISEHQFDAPEKNQVCSFRDLIFRRRKVQLFAKFLEWLEIALTDRVPRRISKLKSLYLQNFWPWKIL